MPPGDQGSTTTLNPGCGLLNEGCHIGGVESSFTSPPSYASDKANWPGGIM